MLSTEAKWAATTQKTMPMPDDPIGEAMSARALLTNGLNERRTCTSLNGAPTDSSQPQQPNSAYLWGGPPHVDVMKEQLAALT